MAMKITYLTVCVMLVVVVLFGDQTRVTMAVTCNTLELSQCASAITSSTPPTAECCSKLKEQEACLCEYVKDPNMQNLVNSPNAKKVADTCGTPIPTTS